MVGRQRGSERDEMEDEREREARERERACQ